ncbi:MAG: repressor LexA [Candidatus Eisenbacteria bacterium]|nr:repressor LexA [Candidatus Eisenbacteria bacterium]
MKRRPLTPRETEALRYLRSRIVHGGGTPSVRDLRDALGFSSPNAAAHVIQRLIEAEYLRRRDDGRLQLLRDASGDPASARTVEVPLVGSVPCGAPLLAEENIEAMIPVSTRLAKPSHRYFLLRAQGDSMNRAGIEEGDLVLVRQQPTAENGDRVVALIDDEATLKEFRRTRDVVTLVPRSTNKRHRPILLSVDFQVQGVVQATIQDWPGKGKSHG